MQNQQLQLILWRKGALAGLHRVFIHFHCKDRTGNTNQSKTHYKAWLLDSVVSRTLRSLTQRCLAHCGVWLSGVLHTAESDSAVSRTLRSLTQLCLAHCGVWLSCVSHTGEYDSVVSGTLHSMTHQCLAHYGVLLSGVLHTAEYHSAVSHTQTQQNVLNIFLIFSSEPFTASWIKLTWKGNTVTVNISIF